MKATKRFYIGLINTLVVRLIHYTQVIVCEIRFFCITAEKSCLIRAGKIQRVDNTTQMVILCPISPLPLNGIMVFEFTRSTVRVRNKPQGGHALRYHITFSERHFSSPPQVNVSNYSV